ncbi:hypothetical protein EDC96DRAFT_507049 [Choanephora cucurbitarum]|nr:hypothetical protein EDC96DRAFT_507042 [Choanephora cucurbitarum]KAI8367147.1 hypothetical protein EDC96DRAFT_507049 [Choanephora cucurbitarum]
MLHLNTLVVLLDSCTLLFVFASAHHSTQRRDCVIVNYTVFKLQGHYFKFPTEFDFYVFVCAFIFSFLFFFFCF